MSVEVEGPPGGQLPADAHQILTSAAEPTPGTYRLTVLASHSDVLLRALLTARPPWHVVRVDQQVDQQDVPLDDESPR